MKNYPPQFKVDAVALYESRPEATIRSVAADLGINPETLRNWDTSSRAGDESGRVGCTDGPWHRATRATASWAVRTSARSRRAACCAATGCVRRGLRRRSRRRSIGSPRPWPPACGWRAARTGRHVRVLPGAWLRRTCGRIPR
ncbi:transposase [Streptomyces olivaceus]|uniref:transposase n=1 Tax=Streptomyces TaxID=1883 RepID=UPI0032610178